MVPAANARLLSLTHIGQYHATSHSQQRNKKTQHRSSCRTMLSFCIYIILYTKTSSTFKYKTLCILQRRHITKKQTKTQDTQPTNYHTVKAKKYRKNIINLRAHRRFLKTLSLTYQAPQTSHVLLYSKHSNKKTQEVQYTIFIRISHNSHQFIFFPFSA